MMSRSERRRASWFVVLATALSLGAGAPGATAAGAPCPDAGAHPWCSRSLSPDARAGLLLRALTQDEKITLLSGGSAGNHTGATQAIDRVGLPPAYVTDGPVGVRQGSATAMPTSTACGRRSTSTPTSAAHSASRRRPRPPTWPAGSTASANGTRA